MSEPVQMLQLKCPNCSAGMKLVAERHARCEHCGAETILPPPAVDGQKVTKDVDRAATAAERMAAETALPRLERELWMADHALRDIRRRRPSLDIGGLILLMVALIGGGTIAILIGMAVGDSVGPAGSFLVGLVLLLGIAAVVWALYNALEQSTAKRAQEWEKEVRVAERHWTTARRVYDEAQRTARGLPPPPPPIMTASQAARVDVAARASTISLTEHTQTQSTGPNRTVVGILIGICAVIGLLLAIGGAVTSGNRSSAPVLSASTNGVRIDRRTERVYTEIALEHTGTGAPPRSVWVWTYLINPGYRADASWSAEPVEVYLPFASGRQTTITVESNCYWCDNSDVPARPFWAHVRVSTGSKEDAYLRADKRNYSTATAIPVTVLD